MMGVSSDGPFQAAERREGVRNDQQDRDRRQK